jgi:hypothetical protein
MLNPAVTVDHQPNCKALEEVRKGTISNPWSHIPAYDNEDNTLTFFCTGCNARMTVKTSELASYADSYVNGAFE